MAFDIRFDVEPDRTWGGFDRWGYGRNPQGDLDIKYLKASYPYIHMRGTQDWLKIRQIMEENIPFGYDGLRPYLIKGLFVFFLSKDDRNLVETFRLIY